MSFRATGIQGPPGPEGPEGPEGPQGPPTWRGVWDSGTDYNADDAVEHNGASWFATTDPAVGDEPGVAAAWDLLADQGDTGPEGPEGPTGPEGPEGPQGPQGDPIVWRGTWDSGIAYSELDAVAYDAESWIANQATTAGEEPGVSASWDLMAQSGGNDPHATQHEFGGSDEVRDVVTDNLYIQRSSKDSEGIFTIVEWFRRDNDTRFMRSELSGGTSPEYSQRTVTWYESDGTTTHDSVTYDLTYDADGDLTSEAVAA